MIQPFLEPDGLCQLSTSWYQTELYCLSFLLFISSCSLFIVSCIFHAVCVDGVFFVFLFLLCTQVCHQIAGGSPYLRQGGPTPIVFLPDFSCCSLSKALILSKAYSGHVTLDCVTCVWCSVVTTPYFWRTCQWASNLLHTGLFKLAHILGSTFTALVSHSSWVNANFRLG